MKFSSGNTEYANGLLKANEQMLLYIENQIAKIKEQPLEPNTPRQISNSGKLLAYNKLRSKISAKINNIKVYEKTI